VLDGFDLATVERMLLELAVAKENLKGAIGRRPAEKSAAAA
jgi:hypothetical protein